MANFPSVTAAGAFESTAVQNAIKTLAEQAVAARLTTLEYDSGLRNITSSNSNIAAGGLFVQRTGRMLTLFLDRVKFKAVPGSDVEVLASGVLPSGMRPPYPFRDSITTVAGLPRSVNIFTNGQVMIYGSPTTGDTYTTTIAFPITGAPPATPPGAPA